MPSPNPLPTNIVFLAPKISDGLPIGSSGDLELSERESSYLRDRVFFASVPVEGNRAALLNDVRYHVLTLKYRFTTPTFVDGSYTREEALANCTRFAEVATLLLSEKNGLVFVTPAAEEDYHTLSILIPFESFAHLDPEGYHKQNANVNRQLLQVIQRKQVAA